MMYHTIKKLDMVSILRIEMEVYFVKHYGNKVEGLKIAYIGGGSQGWAWGLMSDLARADDISGDVYLYDIDFAAAKKNEIIGNKAKEAEGCNSVWNYRAVETIGEALAGADFVVISILPGTLKEMESDIHAPEKFGIWQPVGDTTGPGGVIRCLRTIPMFEQIALAVKEYCPNAWVINYTNPMTVCINTLYRVFPQIKAFGCCHEVFGTQKLLATAVEEILEIPAPSRDQIRVNVVGINHFTWLTKAQYKDIDLFPVYRQLVDRYYASGYDKGHDNNWINNDWACAHRVKFDLFRRFGYIAAAGDRHLAEFCPRRWYLQDPDCVREWTFNLTPISIRWKMYSDRMKKGEKLLSGEIPFELSETGEDGVNQIRALLGLAPFVTNVNIPNVGQIPNLPLGAVVETNASFSDDEVRPLFAGNIPESIYPLIARICGQQEMITTAGLNRDMELAFQVFANDPLMELSVSDAKVLFDQMIDATKTYLTSYNV